MRGEGGGRDAQYARHLYLLVHARSAPVTLSAGGEKGRETMRRLSLWKSVGWFALGLRYQQDHIFNLKLLVPS